MADLIPPGAPLRQGNVNLRVATSDEHRLIGGAFGVEAVHVGEDDTLRLTVRSLPNTPDARVKKFILNRDLSIHAVFDATPDALNGR